MPLNASRSPSSLGENTPAGSTACAIDDATRMAAVTRSGLFGPDAHDPFDRVSRLVANTLGATLATVTVVMPDRQVFVGRADLPAQHPGARQSPISHSFCRHPVETGLPLVVGDARRDPAFKDNPSVGLGVIAYCGVPLLSPDGVALGAVCAIDAKPRRWTAADVRFLHDVAAVVTDQIASRTASARHVRTLEDLREAEAKFRTFMERSPAIAFIKDEDGRFVYANRAMHRYYPECGSWIGRTGEQIWPPAVAAAIRAADLAALADDRGVELEEQVAAADGTPNHWRTFKFPLHQRGGRTLMGGMSVNVNEQKRAEAALGAAKAAAEAARAAAEADAARADAASVAKTKFLSNMSHEIRTPLTAIFGFADLLLTDTTADDRRDYVQTIRRNGEHLLGIINDILDLSKIEADRMDVERIPVAPSQVLADVMNLVRHRATEKGLCLTLTHETALPDRVETDPMRLRQILINLVSNAVKFTHRGRVELRVGFDPSGPTGGRLRVGVVDTGIGLTGEQQGRLFSDFAQADVTHARRFGGTGLGLSISRKLARLLGGELTVASEVGRGSTFTLDVPVGRPEQAGSDPAPSAAHGRPGDAAAPAVAGRVLLADDSPDIQRLLSLHLAAAGATVDVVGDGRLAVDRALRAADAGDAYDLILMDIQMPHLDGYAATAELRQAGYPGPIVALTANAMKLERDRCLRSGCTDFLTKPIQLQTLHDTLARHLRPAPPASGPLGSGPLGSGPLGSDPLGSDLATHAVVAALIPAFVVGLLDKLALIRAALAQGQLGQVARTAHQIRGAAGGYGYPSITEAATAVEEAAAASAPPLALATLVDRLATLCDRAVAGLPATVPAAA